MFPSVQQLYEGTIRVTIAHAIFCMAKPALAYEVGWDGRHYLRQNSMGTRGVITFFENDVIGAFQDIKKPLQHPEKFMEHMPDYLRKIAEAETLQCLFENVNGKTAPAITAMFWSDNGNLYANQSWQDVVSNGAHLLAYELIEPSFKALQNNYELNPDQLNLLQLLTKQKIANQHKIMLSSDELSVLTKNGMEGIKESQQLLEEIGIFLP